MTSLIVPENIRILLSKYTFKTEVDSMGNDLTCTLCSKLMVDAYQTGCECKYCRECVIGYLSEGKNYCMGGKEECKEDRLVFDDNVSRIPALNKKILKVRVHCPNMPCVFISPLALMDVHLMVCGHQPLECPYTIIGCVIEGASKDRVETHLSNETLAHSRLLMEAINNLRNEVGGVREGLRLSQLEVASVSEERKKNETARRGVVEHAAETRRLRRAERRLRRAEREDLLREMKIGLEEQANEIKELKTEVQCLEEAVREGQLMGAAAVLKAPVPTMGRGWRRTVPAVEDGAETKRRFPKGDESAASAAREKRRRVEELAVTVVAVGRLGLILDHWAARMGGAGEEVWSPHVYSHANGYKLRLKVHPGGDGGGAGTHVSVYVVLCRGEHDEVLSWPCKHTVTVSLVNQRTKEAHSIETLAYCREDEDEDIFGRPVDTDNPPCGWSTFVSHSDLDSIDGLVVNDSVLFCVFIVPPQ